MTSTGWRHRDAGAPTGRWCLDSRNPNRPAQVRRAPLRTHGVDGRRPPPTGSDPAHRPYGPVPGEARVWSTRQRRRPSSEAVTSTLPLQTPSRSCGSWFHPMPVLNTNTMPIQAPRFSTDRPPGRRYRLNGCDGSNGPKHSHSESRKRSRYGHRAIQTHLPCSSRYSPLIANNFFFDHGWRTGRPGSPVA